MDTGRQRQGCIVEVDSVRLVVIADHEVHGAIPVEILGSDRIAGFGVRTEIDSCCAGKRIRGSVVEIHAVGLVQKIGSHDIQVAVGIQIGQAQRAGRVAVG